MSEQPAASHRLFLARDTHEVERYDCAGLEVAIYSQRSPAKETANEDGAAVLPLSDNAAVLAIADGVGGARGGELASATALQALSAAVGHPSTAPELLRMAILNGIEAANTAVCGLNIGAATTMAVVEYSEGIVRPYHVGDSKTLITGRRGRIRYQTVAHSPIGYAVESGFLAEKKAIFHEDNHLVSNVVGDPNMRMEVGPAIKLATHDTVLIASDGLFDNLWVEEIIAIIRKGKLTAAVTQLATAARERMHSLEHEPCKPDDLTIIVFRQKKKAKKRAKVNAAEAPAETLEDVETVPTSKSE